MTDVCAEPTERGAPCVLPPGHSEPNIHHTDADAAAVELPHDWEAHGGDGCGYCEDARTPDNEFAECPARAPGEGQPGIFLSLTGQRSFRHAERAGRTAP